MPPVVCPLCRDELDIPAELRGRPVRCAACDGVFTPPAADAPRPGRAAPGSRRMDRDADYDDDTGRRPPARRASLTWLWVLLAGSLGACCLSCGGLLVFAFQIEVPAFQPYTAPDGKYAAGFPGVPAVGTAPAFDPRTAATTTTVEWKRTILGHPHETYFVHTTDLKKPPGKAETARLIDKAAAALARRPGSTETARRPQPTAGVDGVEVHIQHPDDEVTAARVFVTADRVYVVGLTAPSIDPDATPRVGLFFDQFRLTAAADEKAKDDE